MGLEGCAAEGVGGGDVCVGRPHERCAVPIPLPSRAVWGCVGVCVCVCRCFFQVLAIVSGFTQREFVVPDNVVGAIMGKGGERIAKLQADTETSVDIKRGGCPQYPVW